jgi:hypothetical protein
MRQRACVRAPADAEGPDIDAVALDARERLHLARSVTTSGPAAAGARGWKSIG